jgi:hypothetical protein
LTPPNFHAWFRRDWMRNPHRRLNGASFSIGFFWKPILEGHREGDRLRAKYGFELLISLPRIQWWEEPPKFVGYYDSYWAESWTGHRPRQWRISPPRLSLWSFA